MATFQLDLVTPERLLFSETIQAIRAPGVEGSFGVLAGHAPLLAELGPGLIKITRANGFEAFIATSGGFLQVGREKVIILADTAELPEEIDVERANRAAEEARLRLETPGLNPGEAEELRKALERANNRVRIAQLRQH